MESTLFHIPTAFWEANVFYALTGVLIVFALGVSFLGMRNDDFPTKGNSVWIVAGVAAALVGVTGTFATLTARAEQEERREHFKEFFADQAEEEKAEIQGTDEVLPGNQSNQPEEDEAPVAPQGETSPVDPEDPSEPGTTAEEGSSVFVEAGCGSCHAIAQLGSDAIGEIGPNLNVTLVDQKPEQIRTSILEPDAELSDGFAAGIMPANYGEQLTEVEIDLLVAYLASIAGE